MDQPNYQQTSPQGTPPPQQGPSPSGSAHGFLGSIENFFDEYLVRKAPFHLPEGVKEVIVKVAPWITIIIMVLAIPLILAALGLSVAFAPAALIAGESYGIGFWIGWVLTLITIVLEIMSIKGLLHREIKGWRYVYWAMLLSVLSNIFYFSIGGLIGNLIGLYIIFQIKSKYH